ncbi:hypothetical protein LOAG_09675 [Loa loa]|uniref:DUF5641 domain-containing protein n=1 Tax=Loa loa TaxID=7209 RepID=A0A1S0TRF2_LOALO|nr:hypothetical protein LOAG_09675 [Loa loa]EFO18818.1 hypothetical protein LOAG_09675 [Loa loa]
MVKDMIQVLHPTDFMNPLAKPLQEKESDEDYGIKMMASTISIGRSLTKRGPKINEVVVVMEEEQPRGSWKFRNHWRADMR